MVSTTTGKRGEVKRLKDNFPGAYWALSRGEQAETCLYSASGYGAEGLCLLTCLPSRGVANRTQNPFSPTHPYNHRDRGHTKNNKQAGEAKWLKEVRKGEE